MTRSLGDSSMKEFVVGAPYTTETELSDDDEFLILACDGVRNGSMSAVRSTDFIYSFGMSLLIKKLSNSYVMKKTPKKQARFSSITH